MANFAEYAIESAGVPPAQTNADTFAYNDRSEVIFSRRDAENAEDSYSYDGIGNLLASICGAATNTYTANSLNQYTLRASAPPREFSYDADGNLLSDGEFTYAYDAEDRLLSVTSATLTNGALRIVNSYDYRNRRIGKTTERYGNGSWLAEERRTFVYDGWNLIHEIIEAFCGGATNITEKQYFWGLDLSNTLQGAGGVGGLQAVSIGGQFYFPAYDANGNVTKYLDESGNVVATYTYDVFGNIIAQSGPMADNFNHRFSTKYFDAETSLYYYGYRFYSPELMRWLNRDPIEEQGGANLYAFCGNNGVSRFDAFGKQSSSKPVDYGSLIEWDYEVQYTTFVYVPSSVIIPIPVKHAVYAALPQGMPGTAPYKRKRLPRTECPYFIARKLTVYCIPSAGFDSPNVRDEDGGLALEPYIAIVPQGESPEGKWERTWSDKRLLWQYKGKYAPPIGVKKHVDYFFSGEAPIRLEVHRKIVVRSSVDDDIYLPPLQFTLTKEIGESPVH